ncbi:cylicin-1-like [Leptopilina boulardi]|uniref:cylicin-1-like n=1 Tax=Leptopilina boulardi TaxID=63433 RepID=UPI0021F52995|nr:cylicin-1-like [Leptopilina boulardi]
MKTERVSNILNNLIEYFEEILRKAKANDLCHLIEPIEETILKVKELKKTIKVKCDSTVDFQMACSCNDWGPDFIASNGQWMCDKCKENCSCSQIWDSQINLVEKKIPIESNDQKEDKHCQNNENSCETNEEICINQKLEYKNNTKPSVSILYNRLNRKKDYLENLIIPDANLPNKSFINCNDKNDLTNLKCQNCKCSIDKNGKEIKTDECKLASKRETSRKRNLKKFVKEKKYIESSFRMDLEPRDSKDESCREEIKELSPQFQIIEKNQINCEKPEKPLTCSEMTEYIISKNDESNKKSADNLLITVKVKEVGKFERKICKPCSPGKTEKELKTMPKSIKSKDKIIIEENVNCKMEKITTACNECLPSGKRTSFNKKTGCQCSQAWREKLNYTVLEKNRTCSESRNEITTQNHDGKAKKSEKEIKQKLKIENAHCSNNLSSPATSTEMLCSCGCGYFTEGVSEIRPVSCNNISKNSKMSALKNKSQNFDCEGSCEWCNS